MSPVLHSSESDDSRIEHSNRSGPEAVRVISTLRLQVHGIDILADFAREKHPRRRIVEAIFYVVRTGCAWQQPPKHFAPWPTVY
ncbi:transposase [Streptomyces sp. NPDC005774]|uniref:transposase n=1 Tax=Streptomyces sp. NPDC005774 TaxID=3364728 RepID=UPI00369D955C